MIIVIIFVIVKVVMLMFLKMWTMIKMKTFMLLIVMKICLDQITMIKKTMIMLTTFLPTRSAARLFVRPITAALVVP